MLGITMAAVGGLLFSFADAGKKALTTTFSPEAIILITMTFGIIVNLAYLSFVGFPEVDWAASLLPVLVLGILGAVGEALFMYGLRGTDLSLATPLLALTPVVAGVFDYLLFGHLPSSTGALGVVIIMLGAYLLSVKRPLRKNVLMPLIRLFTDRGCRYILLAVLIGGLLFVGQKIGFPHSSPVLFVTFTLVVNWIIFAVLAFRFGFIVRDTVFNARTAAVIFGTGLTWAGGITLVCCSFHYTLAAYASGGQQLQIPAAIILGAVFFGEESFKQRLIAGLLMGIGVIVMVVDVS
jgi:drug/metabolite transporter (DMT)-like permease